MEQIIKEIVVPIITTILGFFGGFTFKTWKYNKTFKSNQIYGDNGKMINGDNYEWKNNK